MGGVFEPGHVQDQDMIGLGIVGPDRTEMPRSSLSQRFTVVRTHQYTRTGNVGTRNVNDSVSETFQLLRATCLCGGLGGRQ